MIDTVDGLRRPGGFVVDQVLRFLGVIGRGVVTQESGVEAINDIYGRTCIPSTRVYMGNLSVQVGYLHIDEGE